MSYATIDDLRSQLGAPTVTEQQRAYRAKMMHPFPEAPVVDRALFVLGRCQGKHVLEFGASGPMHEAVVKAAASVVGIDRISNDSASDIVYGFDLDDVTVDHLPQTHSTPPDLIFCGEVLEHLANPGWFLQRLHRQYPGVPVLITTPNAFTKAGRQHADRGYENVNVDHCVWFSPRTLRTLLERYGYEIDEFLWYHGEPVTAEGMIVVTRG